MIRVALLISAILAASATSATAEEYLLKLDALRYPSSFVGNQEQRGEAQNLGSMEITCRPGERAYSRVIIGKETFELTVLLQPSANDKFNTNVEYRNSKETDRTYVDENGNRKKRVAVTRMQSPASISVNQPIELDGMVTSGPEGRFQIAYLLKLTQYKPDTEYATASRR